MFFGRIDFQDLDRRREARELEMLWSASPSLGESADIWLGVLGSGNYGHASPPESPSCVSAALLTHLSSGLALQFKLAVAVVYSDSF
jgi:hypothetical protein